MSIHELKCWPDPFGAIQRQEKRHEIRVSDRDFEEGDTLRLREWVPETKEYTGRSLEVLVTYLTSGGNWGLPPNICVMSIRPLEDFWGNQEVEYK
jgi:hypothetical protein